MSDTEQRFEFLRDFHLDKRISIGHIVTTIVVAVGMIWWAATLEGRVNQNESNISAVNERIDRDDARRATELAVLRQEIREGFSLLRQDLRALTSRIDRQSDK